MDVLNMVPTFPIMGMLMGLLGRILLALSFYYLGKGFWLWLKFIKSDKID